VTAASCLLSACLAGRRAATLPGFAVSAAVATAASAVALLLIRPAAAVALLLIRTAAADLHWVGSLQ